MFVFFQCWFLERHPWNKGSSLKVLSPCAYLTAFHIWFRLAFAGCSTANSRVQKAIVSLVALKKGRRLSQFKDETRSSLAPLLHVLKRRQRPAASNSGMSKSATLKRGASILLIRFFCCAIPTFSNFVFFLFVFLPQFFHFVFDFVDSELISLELKLYLIHEKILTINLTFNSL